MSIVLVCFSNAPKVSDEAVKRDSELDEHLESRVEGKVFFLLLLLFSAVQKERKKIIHYQMILLKVSQ